MHWLGYLIGYGYLAMLLGIAELLSRLCPRLNREVTRKILHCLIGAEWLALYFFFRDTWQIVVIPATFIIVNLLSYRFRFFHAIEREASNHLGTVYYALAMTGMSVATAVYPALMPSFGIAVACLSFGDAAAALMGRYLKPRLAIFGKSVWGVVGCFVFAWAAQVPIVFLTDLPFDPAKITAIAAVAALTEVLTVKGTDNLFVCLWCFVWSYVLYLAPEVTDVTLMYFSGFVLACVCYNTRSFTLIASAAAGAMLGTVGYIGGWYPYLYVLGAYGVIYCTEHLVRKSHFKERRNLIQIAQNGLCAISLMFVYLRWPYPWLLVAYTIAIAESLADSFAGVMGQAFGKRTVDIITHRPVEKGLSGGISMAGTASALLVCAVTTAVTGLVFGWRWYLLAVALLPMCGMLLDSVLGATLQEKRRCDECGAICENPVHCGRPTLHHSGLKWLTNGRVNLLCNVITTAAACLLLFYIN